MPSQLQLTGTTTSSLIREENPTKGDLRESLLEGLILGLPEVCYLVTRCPQYKDPDLPTSWKILGGIFSKELEGLDCIGRFWNDLGFSDIPVYYYEVFLHREFRGEILSTRQVDPSADCEGYKRGDANSSLRLGGLNINRIRLVRTNREGTKYLLRPVFGL